MSNYESTTTRQSHATRNTNTNTSNVSHHNHSFTSSSRNDTERDPLLPGGTIGGANKSATGAGRSFTTYMTQDITKKRGDLVLLLCYTITGLLDSSATAIWGAFVSMQTGNTVYFGLGIIDPKQSSRWLKSATSIGFFCIGSFFFSRFHRVFSPRKRWVLVTSFTVQFLMIVSSAVIVIVTSDPEHKPTTPGDGHDLHWHVLVPLAMVAFQSSGQAVASRALQYSGLTSVVLTSNYCDLLSDPKLFAPVTANVERNRRTAAPVLLLLGVVLGGLWSKSEIGIAGALCTAAALKLVIVIAWVFWKEEKEEDE